MMILKRLKPLLGRFILFAPLVLSAADPDFSVLQAWWAADHHERIGFFDPDPSRRILLEDGQEALLVDVFMPDRMEGTQFETALALLHAQRVVLLDRTVVQTVDTIVDPDGDGISEVLVSHSVKAGGIERGERSIVRFGAKGEVRTLRSVPFEIRHPERKRHWRYYLKDVRWEFVDVDGDAKADLHEYHITHEGRIGRSPIVTEKLFRFVLKSGAFVRYLTYKRELADQLAR